MMKRVLPILFKQKYAPTGQTVIPNRLFSNLTTASLSSITIGTTTTATTNTTGENIALERFQHRLYSSSPFTSPILKHTPSFNSTITTTTKTNTQYPHSLFHTEADFHDGADVSLETIQDTLESYLEDNDIESLLLQSSTVTEPDENSEPEINLASGVLNIKLPPHGTWVINKQTPNQQLWWSSPISGPRRYDWDEDVGRWVFMKEGEGDGGECLGETLEREMEGLFGLELSLGDV